MKTPVHSMLAAGILGINSQHVLRAEQDVANATWEPNLKAVESAQAHHKDSKERLNFREENVPDFKLPNPGGQKP